MDNCRYIPSKAEFFKRVIVTKDLTPQQRDEKRKHVQQKKENRKVQTEQSRQNGQIESPSIFRATLSTSRQNLGTPPKAMEVESLPSPVDNSTMIDFSQANVTNSFSTPKVGSYNDTTIITDQTIIGGVPGPEGSPV